jgi:hypothetical protein
MSVPHSLPVWFAIFTPFNGASFMRRDYFLGAFEAGAGLKIGGFRLNFRQKMPLYAYFAYFSSK